MLTSKIGPFTTLTIIKNKWNTNLLILNFLLQSQKLPSQSLAFLSFLQKCILCQELQSWMIVLDDVPYIHPRWSAISYWGDTPISLSYTSPKLIPLPQYHSKWLKCRILWSNRNLILSAMVRSPYSNPHTTLIYFHMQTTSYYLAWCLLIYN